MSGNSINFVVVMSGISPAKELRSAKTFFRKAL